MRIAILLIAFLTSYHISMVAQRNIEWQITMGIYSDYFKYPTIDPALEWRPLKYKVWGVFGLGIHIKKWKTLAQLNYETKITIKQSNFAWQEGLGDVLRTTPNNSYIPKQGDLIKASYYYFNPINILYHINKNDDCLKLYAGVGLTGRYEKISTIQFLDGKIWDVYGTFKRLLFMPNLKIELQYTFGKHFFLSTHANYAYFGKEPFSYLQLAFNTRLRF